MTTTLRIQGYFYSYDGGDPSRPSFAQIGAHFSTQAEAEAFAAQFPKSCGLRAHSSTVQRDGDWIEEGGVGCLVRFAADGVNGGRNETGIKRLRSVLRHAERLGIPVEWGMTPNCSNAYPSLDALLEAIG